MLWHILLQPVWALLAVLYLIVVVFWTNVVWLLNLLRRWAVSACIKIYGYDIDGHDEDKQAYSHFSWLLGQFLAQSLTIGIFEVTKWLADWTMILYIHLSLVVIAGIVIGLRATKSIPGVTLTGTPPVLSASKKVHAMDRGSLIYGRLVLTSVLFLFVAGLFTYALGEFARSSGVAIAQN